MNKKKSWTKFRDPYGRLRTKSMFEETITPDLIARGIEPVYTLMPAHKSKLGLPSVYDNFMNAKDPTGYTTATSMFESWLHWERIFSTKQLSSYLTLWNNELTVAMKSDAIKSMYVTAVTEGSKGTTAARYIIEKGWLKSTTLTKKEREKQNMDLQKAKLAAAQVEDDIKRMEEILTLRNHKK